MWWSFLVDAICVLMCQRKRFHGLRRATKGFGDKCILPFPFVFDNGAASYNCIKQTNRMKLAKTCETRECMRSREQNVKILHVRGYMHIHMINDHAKKCNAHPQLIWWSSWYVIRLLSCPIDKCPLNRGRERAVSMNCKVEEIDDFGQTNWIFIPKTCFNLNCTHVLGKSHRKTAPSIGALPEWV